MRQDQLAVHMVSLMDRQLKEAGLDLRLKVRVRVEQPPVACRRAGHGRNPGGRVHARTRSVS